MNRKTIIVMLIIMLALPLISFGGGIYDRTLNWKGYTWQYSSANNPEITSNMVYFTAYYSTQSLRLILPSSETSKSNLEQTIYIGVYENADADPCKVSGHLMHGPGVSVFGYLGEDPNLALAMPILPILASLDPNLYDPGVADPNNYKPLVWVDPNLLMDANYVEDPNALATSKYLLYANGVSGATSPGTRGTGHHNFVIKKYGDALSNLGRVDIYFDGALILTSEQLLGTQQNVTVIDLNSKTQNDGTPSWAIFTDFQYSSQEIAINNCSDIWEYNHGLVGDVDMDCYVNMKDVASFVNSWLDCYDPNTVNCN